MFAEGFAQLQVFQVGVEERGRKGGRAGEGRGGQQREAEGDTHTDTLAVTLRVCGGQAALDGDVPVKRRLPVGPALLPDPSEGIEQLQHVSKTIPLRSLGSLPRTSDMQWI